MPKRDRPPPESDDQNLLPNEEDLKPKPIVVKFRNYFPKTPLLQAGVRPRLTASEIEQQVSSILNQNAKALDAKAWMAPTAGKRNWDIKRDFHRKLAVLDKETEKTMQMLIRREVLGKEAGETDKDLREKEAREEAARRDEEMKVAARRARVEVGNVPKNTGGGGLTAEALKKLEEMED